MIKTNCFTNVDFTQVCRECKSYIKPLKWISIDITMKMVEVLLKQKNYMKNFLSFVKYVVY